MTQQTLRVLLRTLLLTMAMAMAMVIPAGMFSVANASETMVYELKNGTAYVGEVIQELDTGLLLKTNAGKIVRIPYTDIVNVSSLEGPNDTSAKQTNTSKNKRTGVAKKHGLRTDQNITINLLPLVTNGLIDIVVESAVHKNHALLGSAVVGQVAGFPVTGFGFQYRAYVIGDFDAGMTVGLDEHFITAYVYGYTGNALASTFFVGGKYTANGGFVVDGRIGIATINNFVDSPITATSFAVNLGYAW